MIDQRSGLGGSCTMLGPRGGHQEKSYRDSAASVRGFMVVCSFSPTVANLALPRIACNCALTVVPGDSSTRDKLSPIASRHLFRSQAVGYNPALKD